MSLECAEMQMPNGYCETIYKAVSYQIVQPCALGEYCYELQSIFTRTVDVIRKRTWRTWQAGNEFHTRQGPLLISHVDCTFLKSTIRQKQCLRTERRKIRMKKPGWPNQNRIPARSGAKSWSIFQGGSPVLSVWVVLFSNNCKTYQPFLRVKSLPEAQTVAEHSLDHR